MPVLGCIKTGLCNKYSFSIFEQYNFDPTPFQTLDFFRGEDVAISKKNREEDENIRKKSLSYPGVSSKNSAAL